MSNQIFQSDYANIYDLFYREKNYQQESDYVYALLTKFSQQPPLSLLNLGCGTGRHDQCFSRKGVKVTGIDQSDDMIKRASASHDPNLEFFAANIQQLSLNKTFDAVVSLFHVMNYQTDEAQLLSCFQSAKRHLKTGGVFLFDFWHGAGVLTDPPSVRIKRAHDEIFEATRISEPTLKTDEAIIHVKFTFFIKKAQLSENMYACFEETHVLRYWFAWELKALLKKAGFEKIYIEEWLTQKPLSKATWYGCVMAS